MEKNGKTVYFKRGFGLLVVCLVMGLAGVFPLISQAKPDDGRINASSGAVVVKRDPFWPVGYQPKLAQPLAEGKTQQRVNVRTGGIDWDEAMKQVVINGVSSSAEDEYIAVINNEVKSVGESVSILHRGARYTWKVDSITPSGSVKLRRHTAE